jgi:hypothetical protein
MNPTITVFLLGVLGGVVGEVLKWWGLRDSLNNTTYKTTIQYWIITLLMILVGGIWAVVTDIGPDQKLAAFSAGLMAPLAISKVASAATTPRPTAATAEAARVRSEISLLNILAGRLYR